jgi:hypothetical protein
MSWVYAIADVFVAGVRKTRANAINFVSGATVVYNEVTKQLDITISGAGGGSGDVTGPGSSVVDRLVLMAGTTGKVIKQSALLVGDLLLRNGTVSMTGDLDLGTHKIVNGATAVSGTDFTIKSQVDALIAAAVSSVADWKDSVRAATTANITLSGAQTIDGVSVVAGNRVLVKNQSTGSQNGIYVAAAGAWARATDADTSVEVTSGLTCVVEEGTANGGKAWILTTVGTIVLGTTALVFTALSGTSVTAGNGLTGTGTLSVLAENSTIAVAAGGIKRAAISGDVTIADGSNAAVIANDAVTTAKILNANVTTAKIADANVTDAKLASTFLKANLGSVALTNAKTIGFTEVDDGSTGGGTKAIDWSAGALHKVLATGNAALTFTAPSGAMGVQLKYTQDGTGGRAPSSLPTITWLDGITWAPNPAANSTTLLSLYYDGTTYYGFGRGLDSHVLTESTTSRTFGLGDSGTYIRTTNGSATSLTVPPNSTTAFPVDTLITGIQGGAGQITFVAGGGVTINKPATRNLKTTEQYSSWALKKVAADIWDLCGDLEFA